MTTPIPPPSTPRNRSSFRETHPHIYNAIFFAGGMVAGAIALRSCSGINEYLRVCQEQLSAAQSYQGRFRAEMGELIARHYSPDVLRDATMKTRSGDIDENSTFVSYRNLIERMLKGNAGSPTVSVAYDAGSPRPVCEVNESEVERERAISAQLEDRLTSCIRKTEDLRALAVRNSYVPTRQVSSTTPDCSKEYNKGLTTGRKERKPASSEPTQYKSCVDLKGVRTPAQLSVVLSAYVRDAKRPIQVSVNDPALSQPEAARGVVREYCGADEVTNTTLVNQVDALLITIYGRKAMYPSQLVPGQQICSPIVGRIVTIGTESLKR